MRRFHYSLRLPPDGTAFATMTEDSEGDYVLYDDAKAKINGLKTARDKAEHLGNLANQQRNDAISKRDEYHAVANRLASFLGDLCEAIEETGFLEKLEHCEPELARLVIAWGQSGTKGLDAILFGRIGAAT